MKNTFSLKTLRDLLFIIVGTAIHGFSIVFLNIPNQLADGGFSGITLILRALFNFNPSTTTLLLNIPVIMLGGRILGKRSFYYTILGTSALSFWLAFWQNFSFSIDLEHDLLIAALLAGVSGGIGAGLVYKVGATTGGSDVIARLFEKKLGIPVGRTLFGFDVIVLAFSLTYISLNKMMYTLIFSFVYSKIIDTVVDSSYSAKGMLIMSDKYEELAQVLIKELERGLTYLDSQGGFSRQPRKMIYIVITPREISTVKDIIETVDPHAFVSIINVHDVQGEGFSYLRPKINLLK
ncbi:MAG TPA: YitT family protein [Tetragenococcus sp.]|nr:YitT family protein [Tetragenococcus sp.]